MATNYSVICWKGGVGTAIGSVTNATDTITLTAHALTDGTAFVWPNAGESLPGGVTAGTTYYARVTGVTTPANNFKLYDTLAHALAYPSTTGLVDLTSDGSGTRTLQSSFWYNLPAGSGGTGRTRYGEAGSERIFDGLLAWRTNRYTTSPPAPTDLEVCEVADAFFDSAASVLTLNITAASITITSLVDGVRSPAWHNGLISTAGVPRGFIFNYTGAGDTGIAFSGFRHTIDGISIATSASSKYLIRLYSTNVFSTVTNCIVYGYGGSSGNLLVFENSANTFTLTNNIFYGAAYGIYFGGYYAIGSTIANNLVCKCTNGMYDAGATSGNGYGWWYNNVSVGNTTNWSTYLSTNWYGSSCNVGESGNSPWVKSPGTTITTMATTDFTDYTNYDFSPKLLNSPQVEAGVAVVGTEATDIKDAERPNYVGSTLGTTVTAGSFIVGYVYTILVPGTTNFTSIGAADSNAGTTFKATGVGTGTGTATCLEVWDCGPFEFNHGYARPATRNLNFSGLVAGMQVIVYTSGTQTALDTVASSGTTYTHDFGSDMTVDYTVYKADKIFIRETGVVLSTTDTDRSFTVIDDQNYVTSSGLTWGSNATIDPTSTPKQIKANAATSGRNLYSWAKEAYIAESTLANVAFDFEMNGPGGLILKNGWETRGYSTAGTGISNTTLGYLTDDGLSYLDTSGTATARFAAMITQGIPTGKQGRYQQVDGSGTTNFESTGDVNQLIQFYGDGSHGSISLAGFFVAKVQAEGYDQAEMNAVSTYGSLEGQGYVIPLAPIPNGVATGDPGISAPTISVGTYTEGGKTFSIKIVVAGSTSGTELLRYLRYKFQAGSALTGDTRAPFDWHDLVQTNGTKFKTVRGVVYTSASIMGVIVYAADGTTIHPDFDLFTADDGTTYVPAASISISNSNIVQHSTVLLENITKATELDIATDIAAGGYSFTGLIGPSEIISVGDTVKIFATYGYGTSYKENYTESAVATASGITFLGSQTAWTDANNLSTDGSAQTEFSADYPNIQVDITSPDAFWQGAKLVAWFLYNQTTEDGIRNYFGSIASNGAVWTFQTSAADIYIDVLTATSLSQNDSVYVQRDDGVYPQVPVTTGGGGIGMKQTGEVFVVTVTGSNVITGDISDIPSYVPSASAISAATLAAATSAGGIDANAKKMNSGTIYGDGTPGNLWRGVP